MRDLLLPGQRYLHMKNEKAGRTRTIAQSFVTAGIRATVYQAGSPLLRIGRYFLRRWVFVLRFGCWRCPRRCDLLPSPGGGPNSLR